MYRDPSVQSTLPPAVSTVLAGSAVALLGGPVKPSRPAQLAPLTMLETSAQFEALVGRQLAACRRFGTRTAVLLLEVGSTPARPMADEATVEGLLQAVGARLRSRVRGTDIVARIGARRFGVILIGAARADVPGVQNRLYKALGGSYGIGERLLQVVLRIGTAAYPDTHVSGRELVHAAEQALLAH